MATAIFCIARTPIMAEHIVELLRTVGVRDPDISLLFPDHDSGRVPSGNLRYERSRRTPEGTMAGLGVGGFAGGLLGLLAGIDALVIPGVGTLIAAGPIMAALSGMAVGAAVGGIAGGLIGMGVPEFEAKRYEDLVKGGNILMSVHAERSGEGKRIKDIFREAGAEDILTTRDMPMTVT